MAILLGIIGCLALYKWDYRRFFISPLFVKTIMWLPLYLIFCLAARSVRAAAVFGITVAGISLYEWVRSGKGRAVPYLVYCLIGYATVPLSLYVMGPRLWMTVVTASVLSDVTAFFIGKTIGRHHLPAALNRRKTVEGVLGQVVGGIVGILITSALFGPFVPWWAGLAIGMLSAVGDLMNSFAKRRLEIDDWGRTIPGHGGALDRFSSLNAVVIGMTVLLGI